MMYWHKYSLTELESMMPWEKELYIGMIIQENEKIKKNKK